MSIIKTGIILAIAVMLLPADERKQTELAGMASQTAERTVTFCQRNPSTCAAGAEMWQLFLRKAEFGMELAAGLVREQLGRGFAKPEPTPAVERREAPHAIRPEPVAAQHVRIEPQGYRRAHVPAERLQPSR